MKSFKSIITLFVLSIAVLSCSSDDDDNNEVNVEVEALVGTWNMSGYVLDNGEISYDFQGQSIEADYTQVGSNFNNVVVFQEDNTGTSEGGYDIANTTSILGQTSTDNFSAPSDFGSTFDWSIDGDELTFSDITDAEPVTVKVLTLNATTLVFELDLSDANNAIADLEEFEGFDVSVSGEAVYTYTKN